MTTRDGKDFRVRLGTWLRLAYLRSREPVGYVLLAAAVAATLFPNQKLQIGALSILLGIILRLLFEIHGRLE
jgi:hypothetical protein